MTEYLSDYHQQAVASGRFLTTHEKDQLVARARAGDAQARSDIILNFWRPCYLLALRYSRAYAWASPRLDGEELAQEGMLFVAKTVDMALTKYTPFSYLYKVVRWEMQEYCQVHCSLITTPLSHVPHIPQPSSWDMLSLDTPVTGKDATLTLADVLPDTRPPYQDDEAQYQPLYEAIEQLSPRQREVLKRHYGLGYCPESLNAIGWSLTKGVTTRPTLANIAKRRALDTLRPRLQAIYASA